VSRGLGKVQRAVLDTIRTEPQYPWPITELVMHVYHPENVGSYLHIFTHTNAEHVAVYRAVMSLERKGLIRTEYRTGYEQRPRQHSRVAWIE
jgi:hypothetical protein